MIIKICSYVAVDSRSLNTKEKIKTLLPKSVEEEVKHSKAMIKTIKLNDKTIVTLINNYVISILRGPYFF